MMLADVAHANDANANGLHGGQSIALIAAAQINSPSAENLNGVLAKPPGIVQFAAATLNLLDSKFLFASLIWGSVGFGYFVYGKKQSAMIPMIGGLVMIGVSYCVGSWFWMSLTCVALMVAVYWLLKQGY